jgi:hypothetical protein
VGWRFGKIEPPKADGRMILRLALRTPNARKSKRSGAQHGPLGHSSVKRRYHQRAIENRKIVTLDYHELISGQRFRHGSWQNRGHCPSANQLKETTECVGFRNQLQVDPSFRQAALSHKAAAHRGLRRGLADQRATLGQGNQRSFRSADRRGASPNRAVVSIDRS